MYRNPIAWSLSNLTPPEFRERLRVRALASRVAARPRVPQVTSVLDEGDRDAGPGQIKALTR